MKLSQRIERLEHRTHARNEGVLEQEDLERRLANIPGVKAYPLGPGAVVLAYDHGTVTKETLRAAESLLPEVRSFVLLPENRR